MTEYDNLSDNELQHLAAEGNEAAEAALIDRYARLVRICARPYFLAGGDSEDLMQEGMLGLLSAIRRFGTEGGTAFRTYAEVCIRNRITEAVADTALRLLGIDETGLDEMDKLILRTVCERFRNFAAGQLKLYYSEADIRRFIAGLLTSHIMILQGMSGTGKTSLAYAFGEFLDNPSTVVPVQPMWKERTDLIGYYNEFTKRFNETDLLKKMYEANYSKDIYITVLDEMNIARVEYYFAEFLSLLELPNAEERELTVVSDEWGNDPKQLRGGHILLPQNMWFIGTANNDDSTFAISDKVYDRAMVMDLDTKAEVFAAEGGEKLHLTAERFARLGEEAQREYEITKRNLKRLEKMDEFMKAHFRITFGNRIMKQIRTYVPVSIGCGGSELEALDDILAKKVMRKLGMQNPVYLRNQADRFCSYMDELFGEDGMRQCKAVVQRLKLNA